jgi:PEP-CTERM motif
MMNVPRLTLMFLAVAVLLSGLARNANADTVSASFDCTVCSGGPISGPPYVTTNSVGNLTTGNIASVANVPFSLWFDTSTSMSDPTADTAKLWGGGSTLLGAIAPGFTTDQQFGALNDLSFLVSWNLSGASADIQSYFGGSTGVGFSTVHFISNATGVQSADVTITADVTPVPEPGTIALLGTGLLVCGRLLRRKREDGEESAV